MTFRSSPSEETAAPIATNSIPTTTILQTNPELYLVETIPPTTIPLPTTAKSIPPTTLGTVRTHVERPPTTRASRSTSTGEWRSARVTWYGPGLYGNTMACGDTFTSETIGVAHKTLACGTSVTFEHEGRQVTTTVKDRGPYANAEFDLSRGLCEQLNHCYSGPINYRIGE
jgi:rare lipoprotein A (peptidoglycan hydrolase)